MGSRHELRCPVGIEVLPNPPALGRVPLQAGELLDGREPGHFRSSKLERIRDWSELAERARFDIRQLAVLCQVSVRQLERFFKHSFHVAPEPWLKHLRLQEAQALLRRGIGVKEVAYAVGFKQVSHFCREFKRTTGATPSVWASPRQSVSRSMSFGGTNNVALG